MTPVDAPQRLGDLREWYVAEADRMRDHQAQRRCLGPSTSIPALDEKIGGYMPPGLYVIHGAPGSGKSALGQQMAAENGFPALFVSTEMGMRELLRRHVARATRNKKSMLLSGALPRHLEMQYLDAAIAAAPDLWLYDACTQAVTPEWITSFIPIVRQHHDHALLVVDSLHSWASGVAAAAADDRTEYQILNSAILALREIAEHRNVPVLVIAERNRSSISSGGIAAARGSGRIEYACDVMIELQMEADRQEGNFTLGMPVQARFAKNRHGAAGAEVALQFYTEQMRLELRRFTLGTPTVLPGTSRSS